MFNSPYSYVNYISQNRLSDTDNVDIIRHFDRRAGYCELDYNGDMSVESVVQEVLKCNLKLKNPQILKSWRGFTDKRYIVDSYFLRDGVGIEEEEWPFEYEPYAFYTEYEALLYIVYSFLIGNAMGLRQNFRFVKKADCKDIAEKVINHPFNYTFESRNDLRGDRMDLEFQIEKIYNAQVYPEYTYYVSGTYYFYHNDELILRGKKLSLMKSLSPSEFNWARENKIRMIKDVDIMFK